MSFFDLDPTATQNAIDRAHLNPLNPEDLKPGWFAGAWKAPVTGLASAVTDATLLAGDTAPAALRPIARPIDQLFGTKLENKVDQIPNYALAASQFTTPDPRTTGVIGQVVHGLFNVIPEVLAGGPETAAVLQGYKSYRFGMADGLDPGTAFGKGAIDGISTWAGLKIPLTLAPRLGAAGTIATGAAGNVLTGMASRGATGKLLEERGYKDMAEQYKVMDQSAIAVDLLLGGGMGALAHYGPVGLARYQEWRADKRFASLPSDIDTALNMNNQLHAELDTAPGIPTDPAARAAHNDALQTALTSLLEGKDVEVGSEVTRQNFAENPTATQAREEIVRVVEDHLGPDFQALQAELEARGLPTDPTLYQITPASEMAPVRTTAEVRGIIEKARTEGWDADRILAALDNFKGKLEDRNAARANAAGGDRVRGELWVRERLMRAERNGEISPEGHRLAAWLLDKNPALAEDMALSFRKAGGDDKGGMAGGYNPVERIVTIIKGRSNDETAAHEILHHAERMMPDDVQAGINAAWRAELKAVRDWATRTQNETMMRATSDAINSGLGDQQAFARLADMIARGEVDQRFYALANPSEFWAVNGSRILRERASEGWVQQAKQWLTEFIEKVKDAFGMRSDAAVIRGLDATLKSDGEFQSADMLAGRRITALDVKTDTFKRWFGDSKVVNADGNPLVVYHGTSLEFQTFDNGKLGSRDPGFFGEGHYFTPDKEGALDYADSAAQDAGAEAGKVLETYVSIKNPFVWDMSDAGASATRQALAGMGIKRDSVRGNSAALGNSKERALFNRAVREAGHDGVIVRDEDGIQEVVAFNPEQIKSATDNNGQYDPTNPNILMQVTRAKPGVDAPGAGVAQENLNGFEPDLRVRVPMGRVQLPAKPLVLTGTNKKNAARQIAGIDEALAKFPDADQSPLEWSRMMAYAMATDDVPIPPYRFLSDINSDGAFRSLSRLTQGQIDDANHGFENARAFRDAYVNKDLDVETTGKLFMWSFLSRGVSPYTQEGLFIDAFPGAGEWIKKAADGNLTEADFPAYEAWAKSVAPQGSGQPGAGATHNLNAFGKLFLFKMGQRDENGVSLLQHMHTMMEDPNVTGQQIRRWFTQNTEGVGIDNKVVSFTLLVAGFKDVMVLDRVQIRQLWDDGRFNGRNLYDGRKVDGKPAAGSALSDITYGARGLLIYEAVERALAKRIENLYTSLGRPEDASVGRYHWETWVADSQQEASHGTLDAILADAKGAEDALAGVTAKEGEYGGFAYGAQYGRDASGPYFKYKTPTGQEYRFTVPAFREFMDAIKSTSNKVIPTKFKVTESGNEPWYNRPEVDKLKLDQLAQRFSGEGEGAGTVQADGAGQAVPDGAGRGADPYAAEFFVQQNPSLTIIDDQGNMVPAGRALTMADAEIATAKQESQGFDAAIACALRG